MISQSMMTLPIHMMDVTTISATFYSACSSAGYAELMNRSLAMNCRSVLAGNRLPTKPRLMPLSRIVTRTSLREFFLSNVITTSGPSTLAPATTGLSHTKLTTSIVPGAHTSINRGSILTRDSRCLILATSMSSKRTSGIS